MALPVSDAVAAMQEQGELLELKMSVGLLLLKRGLMRDLCFWIPLFWHWKTQWSTL
jgi:hypothetical protein